LVKWPPCGTGVGFGGFGGFGGVGFGGFGGVGFIFFFGGIIYFGRGKIKGKYRYFLIAIFLLPKK